MSADRISPLSYDPSGALKSGVTPRAMELLGSALAEIRTEVVETDADLFGGSAIPSEKVPLDAGFVDLPDRLLAEYRKDREESELGKILATAKRLQDAVDRVVLLGIGGSYMGARALMEACCDPYHNELSRSDRGGRPRLYFEGNNVDNDSSQALLRLLGNGRPANSVDDRWAIVVISKSGGTLETAAALRQYLERLRGSCGSGGDGTVAELVVPVTGDQGKLFDLAASLGCPDRFSVPDGVGGRFSIFSAVGLLPAAILGVDIIRLLEGAAAMNKHFRDAPPGKNVVLDYVAVCHLWETRRDATIRVLSVWSKALEGVGLWYDQLLAESLGKEELGATPLTTVNTRDLHSRAQQHQEGKRDKLITNLIVEGWRSDPLLIPHDPQDIDELNKFAGKSLPDLMSAAIIGTNDAYQSAKRPTADLVLPFADESSLGQLLQMLMLATVVEGRLLGINPYGQPGVQEYKKRMNSVLEGKA